MRWPRLGRTYTVVRIEGSADADFDDRNAEERGNVTARHRGLLDELATDETWSAQALQACLDLLRTSTVTAASEVRVEDAWTDGPEAFCVLYRPPYAPQQRVALRREARDVDETEYRPGGLSPGTEDLGPGPVPDPVAFGHTVAEFDIGEPLGNTPLRHDAAGVLWWGTLAEELPTRPA
jgi:hypothetical protein